MFNKPTFLFVIAALFLGGNNSVYGVDFSCCDAFCNYERDGFRFSNNRWSTHVSGIHEPGCLKVENGPPTITWWTDHPGIETMSMPAATIGRDWGYTAHNVPNCPIPAKFEDIEALYGSWSFTVPNWPETREQDSYRVYYQMYNGRSVTDNSPSRGDYCINLYHSPHNVDPDWWSIENYGKVKIGDHTWMMTNQGQNHFGSGPFRTAILDPIPTPDENGRVTIHNIDIKGISDWYCQNGDFAWDDVLLMIQAAWEVFNCKGVLKTNDMAFYLKVKGQPAVTIPSWTTLPVGPVDVEGKNKLELSILGQGHVETSPEGVGSYFDQGAEVSLTAKPSVRHIFTGWSGDLSGASTTAALTMDSDKSVVATFSLDPAGQKILNGDFSSGKDHWTLFQFEQASGTMQTANSTAAISIENSGNAIWHVQLLQEDIPVQQGENLVLRFDAKAMSNRSINVSVNHPNPAKQYLNKDVEITTEMKTYSFAFTVDTEPQNSVRLEINLGTNATGVEFDNIDIVAEGQTNSHAIIGQLPLHPGGVKVALDKSGLRCTGLAEGKWEVEAFDMKGSRLARASGTGTTAFLPLGTTGLAQRMIVVRLSQDGTSLLHTVQLQKN